MNVVFAPGASYRPLERQQLRHAPAVLDGHSQLETLFCDSLGQLEIALELGRPGTQPQRMGDCPSVGDASHRVDGPRIQDLSRGVGLSGAEVNLGPDVQCECLEPVVGDPAECVEGRLQYT